MIPVQQGVDSGTAITYSLGDRIVVNGHVCVITGGSIRIKTTSAKLQGWEGTALGPPTRIEGTMTAYFDSPKLRDTHLDGQRRLSQMISALVSDFKRYDARPVNEPWYGDYATRPLVNEPGITQNALHTPIRMRSKTAALDRTRYKRRRFLQQLRTT